MARKKSISGFHVKTVLILVALVLLTAAGYWFFIIWKKNRAHFARYEAFGIELPTNYTIHGIDVSHHQSIIDWKEVKQMNVEGIQLDFAFIKATEGLDHVDWQFKRNWKRSKEANLIRGAYHFFLPHKSGKAQARNFIDNVRLEPGDLPPVLDVELLYRVKPRDLRKRVKEWLCAVEQHYQVKPIIYASVDFYDQYLGYEFDEYPLWAAHYLQPHKPRIDRKWSFWQHTETGHVNGIITKVDFDVFNGDSLSLRALLVDSSLVYSTEGLLSGRQ